MASNSLNEPVVVRAVGLTASSLPRGSTPAYEQYILSQVLDFTSVAQKANDAGSGAYDAQVKNEAQDVQLLDHEIRLGDAEAQIQSLGTRLTSAEAAIVSLNGRVTAAESDIEFLTNELIAVQGDISDLQTDVSSLQSDVSDQGGAPHPDRDGYRRYTGRLRFKNSHSRTVTSFIAGSGDIVLNRWRQGAWPKTNRVDGGIWHGQSRSVQC